MSAPFGCASFLFVFLFLLIVAAVAVRSYGCLFVNKDYLRQKIAVYAGADIDPSVDAVVLEMLRKKLNIYLPQRASLNAALKAGIRDHEIIQLLLDYRELPAS